MKKFQQLRSFAYLADQFGDFGVGPIFEIWDSWGIKSGLIGLPVLTFRLTTGTSIFYDFGTVCAFSCHIEGWVINFWINKASIAKFDK